MKKTIALILVILCVAALAVCGGNSGSATPDQTGDIAPADSVITTPYADLRVTKSFYDNTKTKVESEEPYVMGFYTKDGVKLFTLNFNDETDNIVGTLKLDDKNVIIYTELAALDSGDKNYDRNCLYQEEINTIIESLAEDYNFVPHEIAPVDDVTTYDIETPVVTLKYAKRWEDKVKTDVSDDTVKFSCDGTPLFDIVFKDGEGYLLGTYKDTPVCVVYHEVEKEEYLEMIDDVNVILQNLMKDNDFKANVKK